MVARVAVHVGGERPRGDRADDDVVRDQPQRHAAGEVDEPGLARGVRIGLLRIDRDAVDRRDVDHLRGRRLARAARQRRVQRLRQEERRLDVQVHDLVPALLGELVERRAPGGAGVVDQDVERAFVRRVGLGQRLRAFDGRHVHRQRRRTSPRARQLRGGRVAGVGLAGEM